MSDILRVELGVKYCSIIGTDTYQLFFYEPETQGSIFEIDGNDLERFRLERFEDLKDRKIALSFEEHGKDEPLDQDSLYLDELGLKFDFRYFLGDIFAIFLNT